VDTLGNEEGRDQEPPQKYGKGTGKEQSSMSTDGAGDGSAGAGSAWRAQPREEEAPGFENKMQCEGCDEWVHFAKMLKTHQLSGNVRKEVRCAKCHPGFQFDVFTTQMTEGCYTAADYLDKYSNWAQNAEVKEAMMELMDKVFEQLGLVRRVAVPEGPGEEGAADSGPAAPRRRSGPSWRRETSSPWRSRRRRQHPSPLPRLTLGAMVGCLERA